MKKHFKKIGYIIFHRLFFMVKEYNKKNIENKAFVLCPNHVSDADGPIFWSSLDNICIMAKKECFKNKTIGKFLYNMNIVSVNRDSKSGNEMRQAIKYLQDAKESKKIYMLFPQGTISDINKNTINRIKSGAFYIADGAKLPIIPAFIEQPRLFRKSRVVYGQEIKVDIRDEKGMIDKEKLLELRRFWKKEILRLQQEATNLGKKSVRKLRLSYKHANNNNG